MTDGGTFTVIFKIEPDFDEAKVIVLETGEYGQLQHVHDDDHTEDVIELYERLTGRRVDY